MFLEKFTAENTPNNKLDNIKINENIFESFRNVSWN